MNEHLIFKKLQELFQASYEIEQIYSKHRSSGLEALTDTWKASRSAQKSDVLDQFESSMVKVHFFFSLIGGVALTKFEINNCKLKSIKIINIL